MPDPGRTDSRVRSFLDFEILMSELLSHFVELPAGELDGAIGTAQRRVCEFLGLDVSSVWQWVPGNDSSFKLTHLYQLPGGVPLPEGEIGEEMFPWCRLEIAGRRSYAFSSPEEFPSEAACDRGNAVRLGLKSFVAVPLSTGGGPVLGLLNFATTRTERAWSKDEIRRLQLVGRIFAGALGRKAAAEALRESEERLELAAESAGAGLWRLDLAMSTYWVTDQTRRLFGLPKGEPVTRERILASVVPEDRDVLVEGVKRACESGREEIVEYRLRTPDGGERWLSSRGSVRPGPSGEPESLTGVTLDVTERKRGEAALRDLSRRLIRAHEEERALLARELHDDLTQRLALLAIDVGRLEAAAPQGPHARTLRSVQEGLVGLGEDVHSLAYQLHPSVLEELGLAEALRTECERFRLEGRAEVSVEIGSPTVMIGMDGALCLFRVAQEALRNVARHSGASGVKISLLQRDGGLLLTVRDDGVGFDPAAQRGGRSLGLASMRERVQVVGGTLRVESAPGAGTAIVAWVRAAREGDTGKVLSARPMDRTRPAQG